MKKVIFIGGTAYSGSTLIDMVLANSPKAFSCGELIALFEPFRRHHLRFTCGCGNSHCDVWHRVRTAGVTRVYQAIFELFPDTQIIVDSSKNPFWIAARSRDALNLGIEVRNLLIWKTPQEFLHSRIKRGEKLGWKRAWVHYHRQYFASIRNWRAVQYAALVRSPEVIETVCRYLAVPYASGQERYWQKVHHTLFGNTSAKVHLYSTSSSAYENCKSYLESRIKVPRTLQRVTGHQQIHYEPPPVSTAYSLASQLRSDRRIRSILAILSSRDVFEHNLPIPDAVKFNLVDLATLKLLAALHRTKRRLQRASVQVYGALANR